MSPRRPRRNGIQSQTSFHRTRWGPRGLLLYYMLHRIAESPCHGYEILQDIAGKTEGAWRPGAGSVYPMLKKLVSEGLIEVDESETEYHRRTYRITPEGREHLREIKERSSHFGENWNAMRGLIIAMMEPGQVSGFVVEGSKRQFQFAQDVLRSKTAGIRRRDLEYTLEEYALNLERQLEWTREMLREIRSGRRG